MPLNYEFKAVCNSLEVPEELLKNLDARFIGLDHQTDTYFMVSRGRMKLREGNIENSLIHYFRENIRGSKESDVLIYTYESASNLKEILSKALGIKIIIEKFRKIYFIENVKFHLDNVVGLGNFIEVEAIDADGSIGIQKLVEQGSFFARLFNISENDYVAGSYSDLLLAKKSSVN